MSRKKTDSPQFETALDELMQLVDKMEHGNLSLEESLAHFERGIHLTKLCQTTLAAAEQKIQLLTQQSTQETLQPYTMNQDLHDDAPT